MLEFKGQSEQCQPRCPLSQKALSEITIRERGGGGGGGGMLRDGLVKKNLIRTRSRTLQHRSKDELKRERERESGERKREEGGKGESQMVQVHLHPCV